MNNGIFIGHLGMGDQLYNVGLIRYLKTKCNILYIISKKKFKKNIEQMYEDDKKIVPIFVNNDKDISPAYGFSINSFIKFCKNKKIGSNNIFLSGFHKHKLGAKMGKEIYDLPFSFYDDCNVPYNCFWDNFKISIPDESNKLYNILIENNINDYIFIHNNSSMGKVFTIETLKNKLNFNIDNKLIINPNENFYKESHKYYKIAQKFIDEDILNYIKTIINSSLLFLTDSAFLALSIQLPIVTNNCYYIPRSREFYKKLGTDYYCSYEHLWKNQKYQSKNKKEFKLIKQDDLTYN